MTSDDRDREAVWRPAQFETLKAPARYPAPSWEGPGRVVELFDERSSLGYLVNQGDALAWLSRGTGRDSRLVLRMAWYRELGLGAAEAFDLLTLRHTHAEPRDVDLRAFHAAWDAENAP